jgi:hypothetical protein
MGFWLPRLPDLKRRDLLFWRTLTSKLHTTALALNTIWGGGEGVIIHDIRRQNFDVQITSVYCDAHLRAEELNF